MRYGFVIDQTTCIGCHACTVACKTEHEVPLGVNRTWVKYVETGTFPDTTRNFSVMRCNHCTDAPCVAICPTRALFKRSDGIVDFDTDSCIGCKSCMQACPYDALYIDPDEHTAQKCNYCVHRVEVGLEPACVVVCPEQAIIAGDLDDPTSKIAGLVAAGQLTQRSVEQGTKPNLWYKGADEANLDPLGATHLGEGGGIWRDTEPGTSWLAVDLTPKSGSGTAVGPSVEHSASAPPRVTYNTDHPAPWGWRVSSYFLTKGIAAGIVLALAIASLTGGDLTTSWARWGAPLVAGIFLALTGALLVADLKRPDRFHYLLTKGNPGSWLVRGAWILSLEAALMGIWFLLGAFGAEGAIPAMIWLSVLPALATAGYTAFLFAQAEARDLWQANTLLWHMLAGALAAGGGASALFATALYSGGSNVELDGSSPDGFEAFVIAMVLGSLALGVIAAIEYLSPHETANATAGAHHLMHGRFSRQWLLGGQVLGVIIPVVFGLIALVTDSDGFAIVGGISAMAGIWFADDALVKAGQAVPLS
jgi:Fe-S-cluster-containing dehydrogenase component